MSPIAVDLGAAAGKVRIETGQAGSVCNVRTAGRCGYSQRRTGVHLDDAGELEVAQQRTGEGIASSEVVLAEGKVVDAGQHHVLGLVGGGDGAFNRIDLVELPVA